MSHSSVKTACQKTQQKKASSSQNGIIKKIEMQSNTRRSASCDVNCMFGMCFMVMLECA